MACHRIFTDGLFLEFCAVAKGCAVRLYTTQFAYVSQTQLFQIRNFQPSDFRDMSKRIRPDIAELVGIWCFTYAD
ncbi:hypothetical protein SDC9_180701 [bioreactor metagenome]|uniref:Uncharacterized protein n=1 Tax=bioreactor metagenome TaxID=1076179 RepID=A0A645H2H7_9ZZZZ